METREFGEMSVVDTGTITIDGSFFIADPGEEEDERVRVRRVERTPIAGGAMGSRLTAEVRNQVELIVVGP